MTEYDWLLACAVNPDDDLVRKGFADWLGDQGDADRAQYIRVSVKLARQPAAEQNLREKGWAETVLEENRVRWLGPLVESAPADCWSFERGLPLGLEVNLDRKLRLATLAKSPHLALFNSLYLWETYCPVHTKFWGRAASISLVLFRR
jgi:uncharacterized protein (TIGR02996 family)